MIIFAIVRVLGVISPVRVVPRPALPLCVTHRRLMIVLIVQLSLHCQRVVAISLAVIGLLLFVRRHRRLLLLLQFRRRFLLPIVRHVTMMIANGRVLAGVAIVACALTVLAVSCKKKRQKQIKKTKQWYKRDFRCTCCKKKTRGGGGGGILIIRGQWRTMQDDCWLCGNISVCAAWKGQTSSLLAPYR